jgi:hypothetical protein
MRKSPHWRRESAVKAPRPVGVGRNTAQTRENVEAAVHTFGPRAEHETAVTKNSQRASGQRQWFHRVKAQPFLYIFASTYVCFSAPLNWTQSLQRKQNASTKPLKKDVSLSISLTPAKSTLCNCNALSFSMC